MPVTGEKTSAYKPIKELPVTGEKTAAHNAIKELPVTGEETAAHNPIKELPVTGEKTAAHNLGIRERAFSRVCSSFLNAGHSLHFKTRKH